MRNREAAARFLVLFTGFCLFIPSSNADGTARRPSPPQDIVLLGTAKPQEQIAYLRQLKNTRPAAAAATKRLCDLLAESDGTTDDIVIASALDVLRSLGTKAGAAAETLSGLLAHRSKLYHERDKILVVRLRAYIVVTLSEIGFPSSALPTLVDSLGHLDSRMSPLEIGAAARAVGSLGAHGRWFARYLLEVIALRLSPEEFSLERYEPQFPSAEATTAQIEAVRSLGRISSGADSEVIAALRRIIDTGGSEGLDPRLQNEARRALDRVLDQ